MKRLSTTIQGVQGRQTKTQAAGYVAICTDGDKLLSVDNFTGTGERYHQRENLVICIYDGQNCIFEGTHEKLILKLKA